MSEVPITVRHTYTKATYGCYADGSLGHDHVRARLLSLLAGALDGSQVDRLAAELAGEMSDDASEEQEAIDLLNEHACSSDVFFTFCDGDLILELAGESDHD